MKTSKICLTEGMLHIPWREMGGNHLHILENKPLSPPLRSSCTWKMFFKGHQTPQQDRAWKGLDLDFACYSLLYCSNFLALGFALYFYYCVTISCKHRGLKQHTFTPLQSLRVRNLGTASLGSLLGVSQGWIRVSPGHLGCVIIRGSTGKDFLLSSLGFLAEFFSLQLWSSRWLASSRPIGESLTSRSLSVSPL